jgi:hypothetical protein
MFEICIIIFLLYFLLGWLISGVIVFIYNKNDEIPKENLDKIFEVITFFWPYFLIMLYKDRNKR